MRNEREFSKYNDGIVRIYKEKPKRSDFSAKKNVTTLDDMQFIVKLDFEQCSKRQQDIEFAEQQGFSLSLKIKTRYISSVTSKLKAVIDNYLYDIAYTDDDRKEMWLYLEGVRSLDT